jgi:SAM-dependent methyltransferase
MPINKVQYYLGATYHRKIIDKLLDTNRHYYNGFVLDIGGRDRGRFNKPKHQVEKWTTADIEEKHNPDIVLDVCDMSQITSESMDVINATELFEHVKNPEKGLRECYRVLKKGGVMILSAPFLFPIHSDPSDFQRWTEEKWRDELKNTLGFQIEKIQIIDGYFTVLVDMLLIFIKALPQGLRHVFYIFHPLMDLITKLDSFEFVKNNSRLNKYTSGYFIVLRK